MKDKYIKFFKKELVFLLILLVVICFSFGVTYSNFIYNSNSKRAVEMFTSKLSYEIKINDNVTNEISVNPGISLVDLEIRSLNPVKSYYKLSYKSGNVLVLIYGTNDNVIVDEEGIVKYKLLIINNNEYNHSVNFNVDGGFTTNTIDDVSIKEDYIELNKTINIGDTIEYQNYLFRILDIYDDGRLDIISENFDFSISLEGASGYNNSVTMINNKITEIFGAGRSIKIDDIKKYSSNGIINYTATETYCRNDSLTYPKYFEYEKDTYIDYIDKKIGISPSGSYNIEGNPYEYANCISTKIISIGNIEFKNPIYEDIFSSQNSIIATRYNNYTDNVEWGIMSIESGNIKIHKLYDSDNSSYEVFENVRVLINLDNKSNIEFDEIFKVK